MGRCTMAPQGMLQTMLDVGKLLLKEDVQVASTTD